MRCGTRDSNGPEMPVPGRPESELRALLSSRVAGCTSLSVHTDRRGFCSNITSREGPGSLGVRELSRRRYPLPLRDPAPRTMPGKFSLPLQFLTMYNDRNLELHNGAPGAGGHTT